MLLGALKWLFGHHAAAETYVLHPIASFQIQDMNSTALMDDGQIVTKQKDRLLWLDPSGRCREKFRFSGRFKCYHKGLIAVEVGCPCGRDLVIVSAVSDGHEIRRVPTHNGTFMLDEFGNIWEFNMLDSTHQCYYNGVLVQTWVSGVLIVVEDCKRLCAESSFWRWSYAEKKYVKHIHFPHPTTNLCVVDEETVACNAYVYDFNTGHKIQDVQVEPDVYRIVYHGLYYTTHSLGGVCKLRLRKTGQVLVRIVLSASYEVFTIYFKRGVLCVVYKSGQIQTWGLEDAKARPSVLALFSSFGPPTTPLSRFIARDGDHALVTRVLSMLVPFAQ
jgi:hypothetical protein